METLRKNPKEMQNLKHIAAENSFDGWFINSQGAAEWRNKELEHMSIKTSQTKVKIFQENENTKQNIQELWDNFKKL